MSYNFLFPRVPEAHYPDFVQLKLSVLIQVLTFLTAILLFSSDGFVRDCSTELQQLCLKTNELHKKNYPGSE